MHSRRHTKYQRSNSYDKDDFDNNGKSLSYSKVVAYILVFCGAVLCIGLVSQGFSSSNSPRLQFRTPEMPSFNPPQLPSTVRYEDFPDINILDVQAKALALMKLPHVGEEGGEERQEAQQLREEEEEEANFIREQAALDAEHAKDLARQQKQQHTSLQRNNLHDTDTAQQPLALQLSHAALVEESLLEAKAQIDELRMMKYDSHIVMESDQFAQTRIRAAQTTIRKFLTLKYGPGPYLVKMGLKFPDSMMHAASSGGLQGSSVAATAREEVIVIELAPTDYVPYSVYMFLENMVHGFKAGSFHRNAGHVLQAQLTVKDANNNNLHERFAWQEYSPHYPHEKYTLGYAGRPSSNGAFYISTQDNVRNHGPASQGSKSEADSIIGRIFAGEKVVQRMCTQPNKGGNGFIKSPDDYIQIVSLELLPPQ